MLNGETETNYAFDYEEREFSIWGALVDRGYQRKGHEWRAMSPSKKTTSTCLTAAETFTSADIDSVIRNFEELMGQ